MKVTIGKYLIETGNILYTEIYNGLGFQEDTTLVQLLVYFIGTEKPLRIHIGEQLHDWGNRPDFIIEREKKEMEGFMAKAKEMNEFLNQHSDNPVNPIPNFISKEYWSPSI